MPSRCHCLSKRHERVSFSHALEHVDRGSLGMREDRVHRAIALGSIGSLRRPPRALHYCYGAWQPGFRRLQKRSVKFHEGVPDVESLSAWFPRGGVLILDDLMAEGSNDKNVLDLFTKHSHHPNITVLYLCQDMFPPGKYAKSISRNAHYIVAFKNPRDQLGMRNVLLQAFPHPWNAVQRTFQTVTNRPIGYLVLDLHPNSPADQRVVSHLLKYEGYVRVYQFPRHVDTRAALV